MTITSNKDIEYEGNVSLTEMSLEPVCVATFLCHVPTIVISTLHSLISAHLCSYLNHYFQQRIL